MDYEDIANTASDTVEPAGGAMPSSRNLDTYRHHLAALELSPEQESEVLGVLWSIMRTFAEIGCGVDAVQSVFEGMAHKALLEETDTKSEFSHYFDRMSANENKENKNDI